MLPYEGVLAGVAKKYAESTHVLHLKSFTIATKRFAFKNFNSRSNLHSLPLEDKLRALFP